MTIEAIIDRNDRLLQTLEDATIKRLDAILTASYQQLERELIKSYQTHAGNKSLLPNQRKLLILNEVQSLLQLVNPGNEAAIQQAFQGLLSKSFENGTNLAQQLTEAIANEQLQTFSGVPLQAVAMQAQESRRRLRNHSEQFASRASAIVEMGLVQGSGTQKVARQLRAELGITKGRAEAIARTESLSSLNQAAQQSYKEAGINYIQSIATSDSRTCSLCVARNMRVYQLGSVAIPYHVRCRCYSMPWKKEWQKAGLTNDRWAAEFDEQVRAELAATGKQPDYGLSPFEKAAGATAPPEPTWKPEEVLVKRASKGAVNNGSSDDSSDGSAAQSTKGFHSQFIENGRKAMGGYVEELDTALKPVDNKDLTDRLRVAEAKFDELFDQDPATAFSSDIGKEYTSLKRQIETQRSVKDQEALKLMTEFRQEILENSISREEAARLASGVKILKSALKEGTEAELRGEMADFLQMTAGWGVDRLKKLKRTEDRAYADNSDGSINLGRSETPEERRQTLWHELGHNVEFENEDHKRAANEWIRARATGKQQSLNKIQGVEKYDPDEIALPDTFIDPYVGKLYSDGSTEVISVALERFTSPEAMLELYRKDKEHFLLVFGMLRTAAE